MKNTQNLLLVMLLSIYVVAQANNNMPPIVLSDNVAKESEQKEIQESKEDPISLEENHVKPNDSAVKELTSDVEKDNDALLINQKIEDTHTFRHVITQEENDATRRKKEELRGSNNSNSIFAGLGAYCSGAIGGATAAVVGHPYLAVAGGAAVVAALVWTVYEHNAKRTLKTLEQELDELEPAA